MRAYPLFPNRQEEITFVVHLRSSKFPKVEIQPIHVLNTLVLISTMIQFSNVIYFDRIN